MGSIEPGLCRVDPVDLAGRKGKHPENGKGYLGQNDFLGFPGSRARQLQHAGFGDLQNEG